MYAKKRKEDGLYQSLDQHLFEVSALAGFYANKLGLENCGKLLGLLHDLGKGHQNFQDYLINDLVHLRGKIDHSTAGAQWLNQHIKSGWAKEILSLCLVSHHGGLLDVVDPDGKAILDERIKKTIALEQVLSKTATIISDAQKLLSEAEKEILAKLKEISAFANKSQRITYFYTSCLVRSLFSCLVDADHTSSADFEFKPGAKLRRRQYDWQQFIDIFEKFVQGLQPQKSIDFVRQQVSNECLARATQPRGIYTLTVPTGGGKTFSSFRYALHHAKKHGLERIFYIVPFTSIIDQNVEEIKKIYPPELQELILEHHSNLEPEEDTWQSGIWKQNWDSPIIFTTMVQFLNALFSSGTSGARKMHQLSNSLIIFDEIQALPIKCVHLFCNTINFLTEISGASVLLCTATQPSFGELENPDKGYLHLAQDHELVKDTTDLFQKLERVEISNQIKAGGWTAQEIGQFARDLYKQHQNCLVVVNTRKHANTLFRLCKEVDGVFHLSTHQCPAHRKALLKTIRQRLDNGLPVLCISTQLIEAGIDISFNAVIRVLAGLDSIAQAAGRCNRHGSLSKGYVYIVNTLTECLDKLEDIKAEQKQCTRVINENSIQSLLTPPVIEAYFKYFYSERSKEMVYRHQDNLGRQYALLDLLSKHDACANTKTGLRQAFKTAGEAFKESRSGQADLVAPHAGAWIETEARVLVLESYRRTPCGCVD